MHFKYGCAAPDRVQPPGENAKRACCKMRCILQQALLFSGGTPENVACGRVIVREGGSKTAPFTIPLPGLLIFFVIFCFAAVLLLIDRNADTILPD